MIATSFFLRFMFDMIRLRWTKWYSNLRETSYKDRNYNFAIFFFCLMIVVEFVPTFFFMLNINYIWAKDIKIVKKLEYKKRKKLPNESKIAQPFVT